MSVRRRYYKAPRFQGKLVKLKELFCERRPHYFFTGWLNSRKATESTGCFNKSVLSLVWLELWSILEESRGTLIAANGQISWKGLDSAKTGLASWLTTTIDEDRILSRALQKSEKPRGRYRRRNRERWNVVAVVAISASSTYVQSVQSATAIKCISRIKRMLFFRYQTTSLSQRMTFLNDVHYSEAKVYF